MAEEDASGNRTDETTYKGEREQMDENSEDFKRIDAQYQTVKKIALNKTVLIARFQLVTIILSVGTTGSLWLSLSKVIPDITLWAGAVISTLITGITLYMKTTDIDQIRSDALSLQDEIGQFLAGIRTAENLPVDYWDKYKDFDTRIDRVRYNVRH